MDKLDGYKTYLGAASMAALALYYLFSGDTVKAGEWFVSAWTVLGLRHAVAKGQS